MKWKDFQNEINGAVQAGVSEDKFDQRFRGCLLLVLAEIHGDLDQIALAQREQVQLTAQALTFWRLHEERNVRSEQRATEHHEQSMKLTSMLIEAAARQRAQDEAYQKNYGLTKDTAEFMAKILGIPQTEVVNRDEKEQK